MKGDEDLEGGEVTARTLAIGVDSQNNTFFRFYLANAWKTTHRSFLNFLLHSK